MEEHSIIFHHGEGLFVFFFYFKKYIQLFNLYLTVAPKGSRQCSQLSFKNAETKHNKPHTQNQTYNNNPTTHLDPLTGKESSFHTRIVRSQDTSEVSKNCNAFLGLLVDF